MGDLAIFSHSPKDTGGRRRGLPDIGHVALQNDLLETTLVKLISEYLFSCGPLRVAIRPPRN